MSIASESDLPPMLMQDKNGICNYLSINQAVEKARTHSNLSDKFIIDWIYEIVSLDINNRCSGKVITK